MRFHCINLLCIAVKLDSLILLDVSAGLGFLVLAWMLREALIGLFLKYFSLFQRVTGAMQQACPFLFGRHISRMTYMISIRLARASLLGIR